MDSYELAYRKQMDSFRKDLWQHLDTVPLLVENLAREVVSYLLELACQAQNERNIVLGRAALQAIPRQWLLLRIEAAAEPLLSLDDDWEYRRLLEVYESIDAGLTAALTSRGLASSNPEIREAAQDFLDG
jgi:hypothetical protein